MTFCNTNLFILNIKLEKIMRKIALIACAFLGFTTFMNAQEISKNDIGLRLGDSDGFGASISYNIALMEYNRLEFTFGWHYCRKEHDKNIINSMCIYRL